MKIKTSGLGLITLGILLLGAQLVLYLGAKNVVPPPNSGETHIAPKTRITPLPGIFGTLCIGYSLEMQSWCEKHCAKSGEPSSVRLNEALRAPNFPTN
jgi:hypothetical protein